MDSGGGKNPLGPRHDARVQKPESAADRMAALKARVAAAVGSSKASGAPTGGLGVSLHPALQGMDWKPASRAHDPKTAATAAAARLPQANKAPNLASLRDLGRPAPKDTPPKHNPYIDEAALGGRQRQRRELVFNEKGKYMQKGAAMRRAAQLEEMKKRIEAQTRKAGIEEDLESKAFVVEAPPAVEWWDEALCGASYEAIGDGDAGMRLEGDGGMHLDGDAGMRLEGADSIITEYVQHPVMLQPPQDRLIPEAKPIRLTKTEQKKLRRQRRMRDLKEEQAKIRLGLVPAPPDKVKQSNLMRVLGDQAVKDPTAVEAAVRAQIAGRKQRHEEANAERALTKDQKHDKLARNQDKDASHGIHMAVFRIDSLANPQHRYKIGINAEQHALTGVCIMNPRFCLVVVEGGHWSMNKYRKLMTSRISWTEAVPSRSRGGPNDDKYENQHDFLRAEDDKGVLKDLATNACHLVWEGEVKSRAFKRWSSKICVKEAEAREVLARADLENLWTLAKGAGR
jgi:U4/U6 small nuclear ribonucleoprotein PRP3